MAGGYGCDGGALRWLSVVLQIKRGRGPERAERGIAVGDDSVASLEGSGRKQEVARGSRRWRARRRRGVCPSGREEDDRGGGDGLGRAAGPGGLPGERQVVLLSLSISVFIYLFCSVLF